MDINYVAYHLSHTLLYKSRIGVLRPRGLATALDLGGAAVVPEGRRLDPERRTGTGNMGLEDQGALPLARAALEAANCARPRTVRRARVSFGGKGRW